jgi:Cu/Zn superoxide dismutase
VRAAVHGGRRALQPAVPPGTGSSTRAGFHAGDLPNFTAPATGTVRVDATRSAFQLVRGRRHPPFDADGSSNHDPTSAADDYKSDPGGQQRAPRSRAA